MGDHAPSRAGRGQVCCVDAGADSLLPALANMGQNLLRICCDRLSEVNLSICHNASGPSAQRKQVEELILEVDEARQENQRLNRHVQKMRYAAQDNPGAGYQGDYAMNEDAMHLKRLLSDLQRENNSLRGGSEAGSYGGGSVSREQYQTLQQQVQEMQRALQQNQAGNLPSSGSHLLYSSQMPSRYGHSGLATPLSGTTTPQQMWGAGPTSPEDEEARRRMMAMQQENEALRRKVRMLASN